MPSPSPADSMETLLVAVADFRAPMLSRTEAAALADKFRSVLGQDRRLRVLDRELFAGLRNSNDFGPLAQCTQLGCALDIGRQFGAEAVVIGAVSRKGRGLVLTIRLVDVEEKALRQKLASKVHADYDALLARGVPELVARLLDTSSTTAASGGGQPSQPAAVRQNAGDAPIITASGVDSLRKDSPTDTRVGGGATKSHPSSGTIKQILPSNNKLAAAAGIGGALSLGLVVVGAFTTLAAPARCFTEIDTNSTVQSYGECTGSGMGKGEFLMDAGFVLGGLSALAGVIAVVKQLVPAKQATPSHRGLVFVPQLDLISGAVGLATRLDF